MSSASAASGWPATLRQAAAYAGWRALRHATSVFGGLLLAVALLMAAQVAGSMRVVAAPATMSGAGARSVVVETPSPTSAPMRVNGSAVDAHSHPVAAIYAIPAHVPQTGERWYVNQRDAGWEPRLRLTGGARILPWLRTVWAWPVLVTLFAATVGLDGLARKRLMSLTQQLRVGRLSGRRWRRPPG